MRMIVKRGAGAHNDQENAVTVNSYGYDAAGRTTSVVTSAGTTSLTYDYEGRITGITYPSTATNSFTYNGLDTRVGKSDSAGTATYKRDGVEVDDDVLSDGAAAYTPGLSERRSGVSTWTHAGLTNASTQTSSSRTVTGQQSYDAFGQIASSSGTWYGPFGYGAEAGYQGDPDSGLMLLGTRYYDASVGRFLSRDTSEDGRNWYAYCDNNPLRYVDEDGCQKGKPKPKKPTPHPVRHNEIPVHGPPPPDWGGDGVGPAIIHVGPGRTGRHDKGGYTGPWMEGPFGLPIPVIIIRDPEAPKPPRGTRAGDNGNH